MHQNPARQQGRRHQRCRRLLNRHWQVQWKSELPPPSGENVALLGFGRASTRSEDAYLALDGDLDTVWNAGEFPHQWLSVILGDAYVVNRIQLVVAQAPAGPTTHEVWLGNSSNTRALYKLFTGISTEDGQTLDVVIDPPLPASEVLINTVDSPSWVSWREVKIFSIPSADLGGRERASRIQA